MQIVKVVRETQRQKIRKWNVGVVKDFLWLHGTLTASVNNWKSPSFMKTYNGLISQNISLFLEAIEPQIG